MIKKIVGIKLIAALCFLGGVLVVVCSSSSQTRTKKQNMIEMGQEFTSLNNRLVSGSVATKFTDQDFEEIGSACDKLTELANEYADIESDEDISAISTRMAGSLGYLKQQAARKDPLVTVMTYGQMLSFCTECHYQTRWAPKEPEQSPPGR